LSVPDTEPRPETGNTDKQLSTIQEQAEPTYGVDDPEVRNTIKALKVKQLT
jgi:hypothetical protein